MTDATNPGSRVAANEHEYHAGIALGGDRVRDLERQTRLPGSTRSGERDQTSDRVREPPPSVCRSIAAEKCRQRERK